MFENTTTEEKLSILKGCANPISYMHSLSTKSFHYRLKYEILEDQIKTGNALSSDDMVYVAKRCG